MNLLLMMVLKHAFADSVRKELLRADDKQHPLLTAAGLIAVELL
jgi:hypothetical protein